PLTWTLLEQDGTTSATFARARSTASHSSTTLNNSRRSGEQKPIARALLGTTREGDNDGCRNQIELEPRTTGKPEHPSRGPLKRGHPQLARARRRARASLRQTMGRAPAPDELDGASGSHPCDAGRTEADRPRALGRRYPQRDVQPRRDTRTCAARLVAQVQVPIDRLRRRLHRELVERLDSPDKF